MQSEAKKPKKRASFRTVSFLSAALAVVILLTTSVFAWFTFRKIVAAYSPVASPEALFIGAGHRDFDPVNHEFTNEHFEDIRYLYFNGIDVDDDRDYYDYVFCVFGKMIQNYKIQIAHTTNNPFTYQIFHATESEVASEGAIAYVTHTDTPETYYYKATGSAIAGSYLNDTTEGAGRLIANNTRHAATYESYDNVHKYAEPLYWQTTNSENGYGRGDFINYYILRVYINGKEMNDRETDVICIAAKIST